MAELELQVDEGVTIARLAGRLDFAGVDRIELRFNAAVAGARHGAIVDLREVGFLASLGVRMLLSGARACRSRGGVLAIFGASEAVGEILATTGLGEVVPVVGSEAEARAALSG